MHRLEGKVAIVTGAGTGIGRAIAMLFAAEGARIVAVGRRLAPLEATAQRIESAGGRAIAVPADVAVTSDIEEVVARALHTYGALHVVVNNAAWRKHLPVAEITEEIWDRTIAVSLKSIFLMAKAAAPRIAAAGGGAFVNISSVNSIVSHPNFAAYSAAKGGINSLTRELALEFARRRIRFNAISPALIATEQIIERVLNSPDEVAAAEDCYPLGRVGQPNDVAYAALFLASDESSFITGINLVVDGGLIIQSPEALVIPAFRKNWRSDNAVSAARE